MFSESIVLFDKLGRLAALKAKLLDQLSGSRVHLLQREQAVHAVTYAKVKVQRLLEVDEPAGLLAMQLSLSDVLKSHYRLSARWWPGTKRLFADVASWDDELYRILNRFLSATASERQKFWSEIIAHVLCACTTRPLSIANRRSTISNTGLSDLIASTEIAPARQSGNLQLQLDDAA
jgi:hypothetical protein